MSLRTHIIGSISAGAAVALTLGAVAGPAAAAGPPSVDMVPVSKSLDATWSTGYSYSDTIGLHVVLPAELAATLDLDTISWDLSGYDDALSGSLATTTTSFDIDVPDRLPSGTPHLTITGSSTSSGDRASLQAFLFNAVPGMGTPVTPLSVLDLTLSKAESHGVTLAYTGTPSPVALTAGSTLALVGGPGFWTDGPAGVWKDTGSYGRARLVDRDSDGEWSLDYGGAFDGSFFVLNIPPDLTGFAAGEVRLTQSNYLGGPDHGTTLEFTLPVASAHPIHTTRVAGADRYEVAVNVSKQAYPSGAPVAYVVTGTNFPDALSAGPAAAKEGGPLLLTTGNALLPAVKAELNRLAPSKIVIVGGPASVSDPVREELESIAPTDRISGTDRYEVSRNLLAYAFPIGARTAYVATGANFPDALSAGAAAGAADAPVVLVNGGASALDPVTKGALQKLGLESITLVGGPNSVSQNMSFSLASIAETSRYGGVDRFAASANINAAAFPTSERAFLVTGLKFPDALSGSGWAGAIGAPLFVSRPDCVSSKTLATMYAQGVKEVTLIGGAASLTQSVMDLTECPA